MVAAEASCCCFACAFDAPAIGVCCFPQLVHDIVCLPCCILHSLGCAALSKQQYKAQVNDDDIEPYNLQQDTLLEEVGLSTSVSRDVYSNDCKKYGGSRGLAKDASKLNVLDDIM
mmetsp:Transcript_25129/g.52948  ORF Transcript_25129/g.52948 Transcript_25129/m.52948 type:complete len:115 (-) Transcript_25129:228-572(-)